MLLLLLAAGRPAAPGRAAHMRTADETRTAAAERQAVSDTLERVLESAKRGATVGDLLDEAKSRLTNLDEAARSQIASALDERDAARLAARRSDAAREAAVARAAESEGAAREAELARATMEASMHAAQSEIAKVHVELEEAKARAAAAEEAEARAAAMLSEGKEFWSERVGDLDDALESQQDQLARMERALREKSDEVERLEALAEASRTSSKDELSAAELAKRELETQLRSAALEASCAGERARELEAQHGACHDLALWRAPLHTSRCEQVQRDAAVLRAEAAEEALVEATLPKRVRVKRALANLAGSLRRAPRGLARNAATPRS